MLPTHSIFSIPGTRALRAMAILAACSFAPSIPADTFDVNEPGDASDLNPGDGFCNAGSAVCTLRAAIEEAEALPGPDTISMLFFTATQITVATELFVTTEIEIVGNPANPFLATVRAASAPFDVGTNHRVFRVGPSGDLTLRSFQVTNGRVVGATAADGGDSMGGGIANFGTLSLDTFYLSACSAVGGTGTSGDGGAGLGGGIYNEGDLTVTDSQLQGCRADGGIDGGGRGGDAFGGGIYVADGGTLVVHRSTIGGHVAQSGTGSTGAGDAFGGGIYIEPVTGAGFVSIFNSTIAQNNANSRGPFGSGGIGGGGGVFHGGSSTGIALTFEFATVALNGATGSEDSGGGLLYGGPAAGAPRIRSTLFGNNNASIDGPEIRGFVNSSGGNLVENPAGATIRTGGAGADGRANTGSGNFLNADPNLSGLLDHGGASVTYALQDFSPAYNHGFANRLDGTPVTEDQRGEPRPAFGFADIGAFESQTVVPVGASEVRID